MFQQLAARVRQIVAAKPLEPEQIIARIASATAEQGKAKLALEAVEMEYANAIANDALDAVTSARHRRRIAEAQAVIDGWADQVAALRAMQEQRAADELRAQAQRKTAEALRLAVIWQTQVDELQECAKALVAQFEIAAEAGLNFRAALPWLQKVSGEETSLLWGEAALARQTWLNLYGGSAGRLTAGTAMCSPWQVAQGPGLTARAKETISRVMAVGKTPDDETPGAA